MLWRNVAAAPLSTLTSKEPGHHTILVKSPRHHSWSVLPMREWESFLPIEVCERLQKIMDVRYVIDLGIRTESISEEGEVVCTMDAGDKINAMGGAHGGAIFSLADQAFALACNMGAEPQVALCVNMNFLRPGRGKLKAVARKISETRRTSVCEVKVFEDGELIATFQGTSYKIRAKRAEATL